MNIYLTTLGCRLNEAELAKWTRDFNARQHLVVQRAEDADVMVLNTCAVTSAAARKSRHLTRRLHRANPTAPIVLTGCYAQLEPEKVASLAGVDLVLGNTEKDVLVDRVLELAQTMPQQSKDPDALIFAETRTRAFLKVQDGCRNKCAFCVVTVARGAERSVPINDIVAQINEVEADGYREAVLTGVHLGGYGSDLGTDLRSLVEAVLERTSIQRLRLGSLEPWDLPPGFFGLWQNPRLGNHLHLPLQSGSDTVLRRMSRRCMTDSYRDLVGDARAAIPDLTLTTDLIVGFPGETDQEWQESLAFVQEIDFAHMHIFTYSARQGTRAARLPNQLPRAIKKERSRELHAVADQMKQRHLQRFVGTVRRVLWEGSPEPTADGALCWSGYTDNYLRAEIAVPGHLDLENKVTPAVLSAVADGDRYRCTLPTAPDTPLKQPNTAR